MVTQPFIYFWVYEVMKRIKDFSDLPSEVLFLKMAAAYGWPVGSSLYIETIEKYPEYFPKEYDRHKRWSEIPQEVHEAYVKELIEFKDKLWEGEPKSGGIMSAANNDEQYKKFSEAFDRLYPIEVAKEKELSKKYYSKYGF